MRRRVTKRLPCTAFIPARSSSADWMGRKGDPMEIEDDEAPQRVRLA